MQSQKYTAAVWIVAIVGLLTSFESHHRRQWLFWVDALGGKEVISGQVHSLFWILDGSSLLGFVFPDGSGFVQFWT